jgi:Uma2 family endonuclease
MADTAHKPATYADLEAVPDHLVAEIIFGSLVTHPRPMSGHIRASSRLGMVLGGPFDLGQGGPGGWVFLDDPQLHLGDHVVVPDLAGWRQERFPNVPEIVGIEVSPDWICEVLSESTERYDRSEKRLIYAKAGVRYLWLVDPRVRVLEAFVLVKDRWQLVAVVTGRELVAVPPFESHQFSLSALWPFDPPAESNPE